MSENLMNPLEEQKINQIKINDDQLQENKNKEMDANAILMELEAEERALEQKQTDNAQANARKLENKIQEINKNMPQPIPKAVKKRSIYAGKKKANFPAALMASLEEVSSWENVKVESSLPVKEYARYLKEAKTDTEAATIMSSLTFSAVHYLEMRAESWHIPGGQGAKRVKAVKNLLKNILSFAGDSGSIYLRMITNRVDDLLDEGDKKKKALYRKYLDPGLEILKEKTGSEDLDDLKDNVAYDMKMESDLEERAGSIEDTKATALSILENRNSDAYDRKNKMLYKELSSYDPKNIIADIKALKIPDISGMDDYEVLSADLEYTRHDVYIPMKIEFERMVAYDHIKDPELIQSLRARLGAFDLSLKLYDARLKVIAGKEGAQAAYETMAGYGIPAEDLVKMKHSEIKTQEAERFEKFKILYRKIYGKSASKSELAKRRLSFEKNISRREYLNTGFNFALNFINIPGSYFRKDENGATMPIDRSLQPLVCYGLEQVPVSIEDFDLEGNKTGEHIEWVDNTEERIKNLIQLVQSDKKEDRLKGIKTMIVYAKNIDLSAYSNTSTEEDLFKDTIMKQCMLQILSQFKKFVEYIENAGYELTKDERDELNALGALGEEIHSAIGITQTAIKNDGTELFPPEEILSLKDEELKEVLLGNVDITDDDVLEEYHMEVTSNYSNLSIMSTNYKVGADFKFLKDLALAKVKGGNIEQAYNTAFEDKKKLDSNHEPAVKLKGKPFSEELLNRALNELDAHVISPLKDMYKTSLTENQFFFSSTRRLCDEITAWMAKNKKTLTPEQQDKIDNYKKTYDKIAPYQQAYSALFRSPGFVSMVNKGMFLDPRNTVYPGAGSEIIKFMSIFAETDAEIETMRQWKELDKLWKDLVADDPVTIDGMRDNLFGQNANADYAQFNKGMTSSQLIKTNFSKYTLFQGSLHNYLSARARKEKAYIPEQRKQAAMAVNLAILKGISAEKAYELYKDIGVDIDKADNEQLTKRARATEEVFDEIMSWDMNVFSFKNNDDVAKDFDKKYAMARIGMEAEMFVKGYDQIMKEGKVAGLTYDEEKFKQLKIRVGTLHALADVYGCKYEETKFPQYNDITQELLKLDQMEFAMRIAALNREHLGDKQFAEYLATVPKIWTPNTFLKDKNFITSGDVNKLIEWERIEIDNPNMPAEEISKKVYGK